MRVKRASFLIQRAEIVLDEVAQPEWDAAGIVALGWFAAERRLHRLVASVGGALTGFAEIRVLAGLVGCELAAAGHLFGSGHGVEAAHAGAILVLAARREATTLAAIASPAIFAGLAAARALFALVAHLA